MSSQNVETIQGMYRSFAKGDVEAVLERMASTIEWNEAESFPYADRNPYVGPTAVLEGVFARIGDEWESFQVSPEEFIDAGDAVIVQGRYRGKYKKTGAQVDAQFAHVWRVAGGKVKSFQQYADTAQFAKATGA
jgi:uncharacterized protein